MYSTPTVILFTLAIIGFMLAAICQFIVGTLSRSPGTRTSGARSPAIILRVLQDLGPVRKSFTNYSPWRFRAGVILLAIGMLFAALRHFEVGPPGFALVAGFAMLFGIVTLLYVAFKRIDRLDLHTRGLAFTMGRSEILAGYYPDIANISHRTVTYVKQGVASQSSSTEITAIFVAIDAGGNFEVGRDFLGFENIVGAIQSLSATCAANEQLTCVYAVTGRHLSSGMEETVTVAARSPYHAQMEAMNSNYVMGESCTRVG